MERLRHRKKTKREYNDINSPSTYEKNLSHAPSSSSFGASSFLKPRFLVDAKAREGKGNTNLGNLITMED